MIDALDATQAFDDIRFFVPAITGNDHSDVLADGIFRAITEHAFCALVPTGDDAVEGLAGDGIVGRIDDSCEESGAAFGAFALGDLAGDFGGADDATRGILDRRDGQREIDESTVFALADGVEMLDAFAALNAGDDAVLF